MGRGRWGCSPLGSQQVHMQGTSSQPPPRQAHLAHLHSTQGWVSRPPCCTALSPENGERGGQCFRLPFPSEPHASPSRPSLLGPQLLPPTLPTSTQAQQLWAPSPCPYTLAAPTLHREQSWGTPFSPAQGPGEEKGKVLRPDCGQAPPPPSCSSATKFSCLPQLRLLQGSQWDTRELWAWQLFFCLMNGAVILHAYVCASKEGF